MPVGHGAHAVARSAAGLAWTLAGVAAFLGWLWLLSVATDGGVDDFEPWQWAAPFVGATVAYLLGSAVALAASHPWRWVGGVFAVYVFLDTLRGPDMTEPLPGAVDSLLAGHFGLTTLFTGFVRNESYSHGAFPDARAWLAGTGLWMTLALSLFLWAACRQPDPPSAPAPLSQED
jgi:hypothetical protein